MHWYGEIPKTHGYVKKATCSTTRTTQPFYMNLYNICVCVTHKCIEWGWKDGGHTTVLANLEERCENGDEDERSSLELSLVWIFYHKNVFVTCVIFKRLLGAGNLLKTRSIKLIELLWHLTSSHPHPLLRAKKKKNQETISEAATQNQLRSLNWLVFFWPALTVGGVSPRLLRASQLSSLPDCLMNLLVFLSQTAPCPGVHRWLNFLFKTAGL